MGGSGRTLAQVAQKALRTEPTAQAVDFNGRWTSWGELRCIAARVAELIAASGLPVRSPIAFVPRNRPAAVAAELGMIAQGHTVKMVYAFQSKAGIARDIQKLGAGLVVLMAEDVSEDVLEALRAEGAAAIALSDDGAGFVSGFEVSRRAGAEGGEDQLIEILTSGTTGPPKRFALREATILSFLGDPIFVGDLVADPDAYPPALNYFPLGNLSGVYLTLSSLLNGLRLTLLDRFTLERWRDYVVRFRPVSVAIPPTYLQALISSDVTREDLASLQAVNAGASPVDGDDQRRFEERFGIPVLVSYGATEFGGRVAQMSPEDHALFGPGKICSVGRAFGGARLRIVDPESGGDLGLGREGLLEVVAPRIGPAWIRTADIGLIDEDGFLFLRGRADSAIMRGGFKILPETIEQALLEHPAVAAASVVGIPDRRLGQAPAVAIKLKPQALPPEVAELEAHLRERVLATHIPVAWRFVDAFPLTASLKISRPDVAKLFVDGSE